MVLGGFVECFKEGDAGLCIQSFQSFNDQELGATEAKMMLCQRARRQAR